MRLATKTKSKAYLYLVVGYLTVKHAHVEQQSATARSAKIKAEVFVGEAVRSLTRVNLGDTTNVDVSVNQNRSNVADIKFDTLNEQICSIQFQKLGFKWYSSHTVDKAILEKDGVWKAYRSFRG